MKRNRLVTLQHKTMLSPNLMRLSLHGEELADFPVEQESGYIKLLFPVLGEQGINAPLLDDKDYFKSLRKRTLTIRAFDSSSNMITVDGVCHSFGEPDQGPANHWLETASVGDLVWINGPGEKKLINQPADWFFFAGDMTALPAIAVNLSVLPDHAKGVAVIEVMAEEDILDLPKPAGVMLHWVVNPTPKSPNKILAEKVRSLEWQSGQPAVWVAGEFEMMRDLRRYFKQEKSVHKQKVYASSYWKMGESDEGNKAAKRLDEQQEGSN